MLENTCCIASCYPGRYRTCNLPVVLIACNAATGSNHSPTLQSHVSATITFKAIRSTAPLDPGVASIVASDITAYVGGANPLVMATPHASAIGPNLAIDMVALYPANSQLPSGNSGSIQARQRCAL